jgi:hypothetical protein
MTGITVPLPHPLLDLPPVRAARLAEIEDRAAALMGAQASFGYAAVATGARA